MFKYFEYYVYSSFFKYLEMQIYIKSPIFLSFHKDFKYSKLKKYT